MSALVNTLPTASPGESPAWPAPEFGYSPDSGMGYRRCADGRWYVLDVTGAEELSAAEAGIAALEVATR